MAWKTGIDVRVKVSTITKQDDMGEDFVFVDESNLGNYGPGNYFPNGPTCEHNGKTIPCATFVSESGGITAEILVSILQILDGLQVFSRDDGSMPFLLLDGHSTRLDPLFLAYVNNPAHRWKICLGVPYATTLWQLGDR